MHSQMSMIGVYVRGFALETRTPTLTPVKHAIDPLVPSSQPAETASAVAQNRPYVESLELARFVLEGQRLSVAGSSGPAGRAPANSESWFLSECHRFLAADGIAGVVSFADPAPRVIDGRTLFVGHVGPSISPATRC